MRRLSSLDAQFLAAKGGNFGAQYGGVGIYETTELTELVELTTTGRSTD